MQSGSSNHTCDTFQSGQSWAAARSSTCHRGAESHSSKVCVSHGVVVQWAKIHRILLDASTRRFQAHRIYLRAAAGMRWVHLRAQLANRNLDHEKLAAALGAIDARLNTVSSNPCIDRHDLQKSHVSARVFPLLSIFGNDQQVWITNI